MVITKWQYRADTAANWLASAPTLAAGEIGVEKDTQGIKVGDGITAWAALPYLFPVGGTVAAIGALFSSTGQTLTPVVSAHADTAGVAANPTRKGLAVRNDANTTVHMQKAPGAASAASFYPIQPGGLYEDPDHYLGAVRLYWDLDGGGGAPVGNAIIREAT